MQQVKIFSNYDDAEKLQNDVNLFMSVRNIEVNSVEFTHAVDNRPQYVETIDLFSAMVIYYQLKDNEPKTTDESIIETHKEFLRNQIAETQRTKERGNVFSVEKDIISGGLMALEAALNHIESLGVEK